MDGIIVSTTNHPKPKTTYNVILSVLLTVIDWKQTFTDKMNKPSNKIFISSQKQANLNFPDNFDTCIVANA